MLILRKRGLRGITRIWHLWVSRWMFHGLVQSGSLCTLLRTQRTSCAKLPTRHVHNIGLRLWRIQAGWTQRARTRFYAKQKKHLQCTKGAENRACTLDGEYFPDKIEFAGETRVNYKLASDQPDIEEDILVQEFIYTSWAITGIADPLTRQQIRYIRGNLAYKFVWRELDSVSENFTLSVFFFSNTSTPNSWFLSVQHFGVHHFHDDDDQNSNTRPVLLQATDPSIFQNVLRSFRSDIRWSWKDSIGELKEHFGRAIGDAILHAVPLTNGTFAYEKQPDKKVTAISVQTSVLYGVVIGLAIILLPIREILSFILVRYKNIRKAELFANNFDEFSKLHREKMELVQGVELSCDFAYLQVPNIHRVHPYTTHRNVPNR